MLGKNTHTLTTEAKGETDPHAPGDGRTDATSWESFLHSRCDPPPVAPRCDWLRHWDSRPGWGGGGRGRQGAVICGWLWRPRPCQSARALWGVCARLWRGGQEGKAEWGKVKGCPQACLECGAGGGSWGGRLGWGGACMCVGTGHTCLIPDGRLHAESHSWSLPSHPVPQPHSLTRPHCDSRSPPIFLSPSMVIFWGLLAPCLESCSPLAPGRCQLSLCQPCPLYPPQLLAELMGRAMASELVLCPLDGGGSFREAGKAQRTPRILRRQEEGTPVVCRGGGNPGGGHPNSTARCVFQGRCLGAMACSPWGATDATRILGRC
ncbi:unnamed protein product [Caretta caretta]